MKLHVIRFAALASLAFTLVACGGGGGGGGEAAAPSATQTQALVRAALPTLVQDIEPAGERIDLRSRNYFPLGDGDTLTYDKTKGSTVIAGAVKRTTSVFASLDPVVVEVDEGVSTSDTYRRIANGILAIDPLGSDAPPAVRTLVGNVLEYPEPFFAIGAVRTSVRQGGFGVDLDSDGIEESFRLEIKQSLVGLETLPLPLGTAEMAHFTTTGTLTISPSRQSSEVSTVITTENSWFAPGIGLVRANYVSTRPDGTVEEPFYSIAIASGRVSGVELFAPPPFVPDIVKLSLTHNALVFDAPRNRYYASVKSADVALGDRVFGQRNTIATIDPRTGGITYSAVVGSNPGPMAISSDGNSLFVGLTGSGDIVKLRLPDMAELSRTRLPIESFAGQSVAESISASPVEPDLIAVATGSSDRAVVLVRNGVIQPRRTLNNTGVSTIVFDANGQFVYAFDKGTSEAGLRRIQVVTDGLIVRNVLIQATDRPFSQSLDFSAQGLVLESRIYRSADLMLLGQAPGELDICRAHNVGNRLVCRTAFLDTTGTLTVLDATTFAVVSTPSYGSLLRTGPSQLVPGPVGQVAMRFPSDLANPANLWLFNHPGLK